MIRARRPAISGRIMGEISRLLNNEGAFTTLRGNQRGITAFLTLAHLLAVGSAALGHKGSGSFMSGSTHRAHKVAFTVAALISEALSTTRTLGH